MMMMMTVMIMIMMITLCCYQKFGQIDGGGGLHKGCKSSLSGDPLVTLTLVHHINDNVRMATNHHYHFLSQQLL